MISNLRLSDFKCFRELELEFGRLNVLAGSNGTGKSTVIQALLLIYQSVRASYPHLDTLVLNGALVELGTGRDVLYKRSENDFFSVKFRDGARESSIASRAPLALDQHFLAASCEPLGLDVDFFLNDLYYLSADRLGPQRSYPSSLDARAYNRIGKRGEFGPLLYSQSRSQVVQNPLLILESAEQKKYTDLDTQFRLWMTRLFPGIPASDRADSSAGCSFFGLRSPQAIR
jgi:predicted ATPase